MPDDELRAYYEAEARARRRTGVSDARRALRATYIRTLLDEGRCSLIDLGSGPGVDGPAFVEAGIGHTGVDLAVANAHLAAEIGMTVVPASVTALPFRPGSFDAAWSASVLMHLDEHTMRAAVRAMADVLQPDAPVVIGLWCSDDQHVAFGTDDEGNRRPFHLRQPATNVAIVEERLRVTSTETWPDAGGDDELYLVIRARTGRSASR